MGKLGNYLRARRRQWQLSQKELAFLLGYKNESIVSRLERHERRLTFGTSRACNIIFGTGIEEIFPALSNEADEQLLHKMQELRGTLEQRLPSKRTEVKLRLLEAAIARLAAASHQPQEV
jgi:transcriptional regulator with XRE-family HTH domain